MASLARGGETAQRIRDHDWASTAIGPFEAWPVELRAAVGIMVRSDLAMALLWGDSNVLLYNDSYCRHFEARQAGSLGAQGDEQPHFPASVLRKVKAGQAVHLRNEKAAVHRDGHPKDAWFDFGYSPLFGETGEAEGVLAVMVETTDRVTAAEALQECEERVRSLAGTLNVDLAQIDREERVTYLNQSLRASESRLLTLIEGIPQIVWRSSGDGRWQWSSPQWQRATGQSPEESVGFGWLEAVHPDDREFVRRAWSEADGSGALDVECRIYMVAKEAYRWFQTRAAPCLGEGGVVEWLGTSTDVDELRELHRHQKVLLDELQHRVRNTLAVVRAIARKTAEALPESHPYPMHLDGRLDAFARAQATVTLEPGRGFDLETIVLDEIQALNAGIQQIRITGPALRLKPKAGQLVSLAIHEIATNALKFGAFAVPTGRAEVDWAFAGEDASEAMLRFTWSETGFVPIDPGKREGFGFELLRRTLPYEIDARTDIRFGSNGIAIRLDLPRTQVVATED